MDPLQADLTAVFFVDEQRGWAVGGDGAILATRDGGATWTAQASGVKAWLYSVQFAADGQRGWAVGDGGTILATHDGGNSWAAQASGTVAPLFSMQFADDGQRGWAVGSGGTILATRDGGSSWAAQPSGTKASLLSVHFPADGLRGWAVGRAGTILATRDGGNSWAEQASGITAGLYSVQVAVDGQRGWAVGYDGTILATRDGGNSWVAQTSGTGAWLNGVQFAIDGQRGWVVGYDGTILATRDGGNSWVAQTSGTRAFLSGVQFATDGQRGWVVGYDGTILATRDGGNSWVAQTSGTGASLSSVHFAADGQRGWAVGRDGTILATLDGGQRWNTIALYQRYWAPWYFAALVLLTLAAFTLLAFVESSRAAATGGAATFLRSDQPVADKALDRLGVRPLVEALSSFMRNRDTEPRVTIAVTGEWGNGKSSVMRMLQTDLNRAGFRTAWFNAWHHQQEGKQMSALFNVVRSQGVPQWWRQPLAAWRVRSRLIWGRSWFYKTVAVVTAIMLVLFAGNLLSDGWGRAYERMQANFRHHVLQHKQTAITGASLARLDPFAKTASASTTLRAGEQTLPTVHPCDMPTRLPGQSAVPIRPEVFCYLRRNLQWEEDGDASNCAVQRKPSAQNGHSCVFPKPEDLLATVEASNVAGGGKLLPSERKAIRAAAETVPPQPMFPWLDSTAFGGIAALLGALFAKGFTVYGLQFTAPLRSLFAAAQGKSEAGGKEASGTVERYRTEFRLLCDALDGRLVIFIDDLDRCTPETVNGMLELTNYLADVGRCFIVIGAAMERVLKCVKSPVGEDPDYPTAYLRKLVHIELPVPQHRDRLNQLASAPPAAESRRPGLPRWALRSVGAVAFLSVLYLAFLTGSALHEGSKGEAFVVVPPPVAQTGPSGQPEEDQKLPSPTPPSPTELPAQDQEVGLVPARPADRPWAWLGGALLVICTALGLAWLRRNREQVVVALGGALRSEDSDRFMQALGIWNPVVISYDPTPRHVKRFYNRARLFAAYERQQGGDGAASDESLVALAAMHHLDPALLTSLADAWTKADPGARAPDVVRAWLQARAPSGAQDPAQASGPDRPADALRNQALRDAWTEHLTTFDTAPSLEQILRFARRVEGIMVR
ncbi:YCF48-related protein [Oryzisolibacter sp. LB2S]|uniref:YCF48-related protein n=1 Tax=Alicycliphilus soli TaxID=3228789 RepID=UPI00345826EA